MENKRITKIDAVAVYVLYTELSGAFRKNAIRDKINAVHDKNVQNKKNML